MSLDRGFGWPFATAPALAVPSVLEPAWLRERLGSTPSLAAEHGDAAVVDFLERLAASAQRSGDRASEAAILPVLRRRLDRDPRSGHARRLRHGRRLQALAAHVPRDISPTWLRLRGAAARPFPRDGAASHGGGDLSRANAALRAAMRRPDAPVLYEAGAAYAEAGLATFARRCLERAEPGLSDRGRCALLLGRTLFELEEFEAATAAFERAAALGQSRETIVRWQAAACYETGRLEAAAALALQTLAHMLPDGQTWVTSERLCGITAAAAAPFLSIVGNVLLAAEEPHVARGWLAAATAADPSHSEGAYGLGLVALATGEWADAERHFTELAVTDSLGTLGLGWLAAARGTPEAAASELGHAVAVFPRHALAHLRLGESLYDLGRWAEALAHLRRARALGLEDRFVVPRLALASLAAGDPEAACTLFASCPRPELQAHRVQALTLAANRAIHDSDTDRALGYARAAHALAADDPLLAERYGLLLYAAGRAALGRAEPAERVAETLEAARALVDDPATRAGAIVARMLTSATVTLDDLAADPRPGDGEASFVALLRLALAYQRGDHPGAAAAAEALPARAEGLAALLRSLARLHLAAVRPGARLDAGELDELAMTLSAREIVQAFADRRSDLNRLLVSLLFLGQGRRQAVHLVRRVEVVAAAAEPAGFWEEARAFAEFLTVCQPGASADGMADFVARWQDCGESSAIADLTGRARRGEIARRLEANDFAAAGRLLAVEHATGAADDASRVLAASIDAVMTTESREAAELAATRGDQPRARGLWSALAARGDSDAAHHLGASYFTEAIESVRHDPSVAVDLFTAGLPAWTQLAGADDFWAGLRDKCRRLHSNNFPFEAETFEGVRRELAHECLAPLAELGVSHGRAALATGASARARELSHRCGRAILSASFGPDVGRRVFETRYARPLLDGAALDGGRPDRFEAALRSAELVLDCDPHSAGALQLALRTAAAQGEAARHGGLRLADEGDAVVRRFSRVRTRVGRAADTIRADDALRRTCRVFWHEFFEVLSLTVTALITDHNASSDPGRQRQLLRRVRGHCTCAYGHAAQGCRDWDVTYVSTNLDTVPPQLDRLGITDGPPCACEAP